MNPIIKTYVLPLVGTLQWNGFNRNSIGSIMSLRSKFVKHINARNADRLKGYLAFCIQEWPAFEECPIERELIDDALHVIKLTL